MRTKGFEFAADTTKQIITLSTGIIALTVTFAKEFRLPDSAFSVPISLKISWLFFCLAIFAAVITLMAITGSLDRLALISPQGNDGNNLAANSVKNKQTETLDSSHLSANDANIRRPAIVMVLAFFGGLVCTVIAGWSISG